MNLAVGISLIIAFIVFAFYGAIGTKHAARFRYLGPRTVYLTLFFAATSSILIMLIITAYIVLLLN
ncbi:hypothetical protein HOD30_04790 [Candidatus Peregrinibacteria bacterium]|nr:hypothetical protein [Candidatus Peregrinibacteria bacterium]MBT4631745.1 hypothetical protein [Candidatus Peregrinibacteria bacterium]MBT5517245.1 hypothetical protein [Candidatus Peregrinibacteria bacterium]MBT5824530.1 hypothetical protein [Candidatus Peregrinibacteria bacterium]